MKNLIQYIYSCSNAMFNYLNKGEDLDVLVQDLARIEVHANKSIGGKDKTLWFKFGSDDTLATDIKDMLRDLSLHKKHSNRLLILDKMKMVTKDTDPNNELRVFYS